MPSGSAGQPAALFVHDAQGGFDDVLLDIEHWTEPDGAVTAAQHQQSQFKCALPKGVSQCRVRQIKCQHQSPSAHGGDNTMPVRQVLQSCLEQITPDTGMLNQFLML